MAQGIQMDITAGELPALKPTTMLLDRIYPIR
jgi:hypothetical protein